MASPHSPEAENRVLECCFSNPAEVIPIALRHGLQELDFYVVRNQWLFKGILAAWTTPEMPVEPGVVAKWLKDRSMWNATMDTVIADLSQHTGTAAASFWVKQVIDHKLRRDKIEASKAQEADALNMDRDPFEAMAEHQRELDRIASRYSRMNNPALSNPADDLRMAVGWFVQTGMPFIDRWMRLVSQELHTIAGDPGTGKTTVAIQMATYNIKRGTPVVLILAETFPLEIKLSMLLQTGEVSAPFINRVRYDQTARTEQNLYRIEQLWEEWYASVPLTIYKTDQGPDEVISIINSHTDPALVIGDHAYAMVAQSKLGQFQKEHQQYIHLMSGVLSACQRNNHVGVMMNQFTKAGRQTEDRGPDAQYGGSGVQNISGSMIHLRPDESPEASVDGYRLIHSKCVKVRALILADAHGNTIEPRDQEDRYWLESRYRRIVDELPTTI